MDPYIGKMLDNRYEILELIGRGCMANVYKAKCHRLDRLVAVKILHSDLAQNADFRRRFMDESRAVAQLSHPNIVSVYDVSCSDDIDYIVMELIDGVTLKQYMERRGHMDWREALHFITQIMRGLSHAHSRGIIHRDIKPQNIMVLRDGSVKVADFGIACLANAGQTLTQEALGSVHYISPEQARGDRIDARSDIYSAGVVLYEMLTGRLPFEGDSAVSVAIQHLSSVPLAPRDIDPSIPEPLPLIVPFLACVAIAVVISAFNGFGMAKLHMHPFIVTLGTQLISYGLCCIYIENQPSGSTQALSSLDQRYLALATGSVDIFGFKLPYLVLIFLLLGVVTWIVWNKTRFGKNMFAVGGNSEAAEVSGVSVTKTIMGVFLYAGLMYGIASFLEGARIQSVGTATGINYELDAIAGCVIGGVSFNGGIGTVPGVVIGSIILQAINYGLYFSASTHPSSTSSAARSSSSPSPSTCRSTLQRNNCAAAFQSHCVLIE